MSLRNSIPPNILEKAKDLKVIDVGFGAGPSCVAGKGHSFTSPVPFDDGLAWLDGYSHVLKRAHIRFENGTTLWFDSAGYLRYDEEPSKGLPRPGVSVG